MTTRGRGIGTVRFRVTALAVVVTIVVLVSTAVGLVTAQRAQLTANLDASLEQRAADIVVVLNDNDAQPGELGGSTREGFAQVVGHDGDVVTSTPNLAGAEALPLTIDPERERTIRTVTGLEVDDDSFRVLTQRVDTEQGDLLLHVAATHDDVAESIAALTSSLAIALPIAVVLLGLLVWWLAGRTLAPVERIRSQVAAIGSDSLERRVPQPSGTDEIARLAETMNRMLDRVSAAVITQQQFVADASHELRSPLTRVRAQLEIQVVNTTDDVRSALESTIEDVIELQRLVEDLLHLARADAGRSTGALVPLDLDDLVLREVRRVREDGRVDVDSSAVSAAMTIGDSHQLARAVRNLIDNAVRHAGSRITLTLTESDGSVTLTVADDGAGIPADQRDHIFERFTRLDDARSRDVGGTGLGLAITREIVERHGGSITVDSTDGDGTVFTVNLPGAPAAVA